MTSEQYIADLKDALKKLAGVRPVGQEYIRLVNDTVLGGLDYLGQSVTRAMYADLWAWLNENQPSRIISESDWQAMYTSQNGNVPYYSSGDGSTTFRLPRVVGYFKGAGTVAEVGHYTKEGLPDASHTHTRGTMNITGDYLAGAPGWYKNDFHGALYLQDADVQNSSPQDSNGARVLFDASRAWTGETSEASLSDSNPIFGSSSHVTPETVGVVMGVVAFGVAGTIGEATAEGILAEVANLGSSKEEAGVCLPLDGSKPMTDDASLKFARRPGQNIFVGTDGGLMLGGGGDGAYIKLRCKDDTGNPGGWMIVSNDGSTGRYLIAQSDGRLTWRGKLITCADYIKIEFNTSGSFVIPSGGTWSYFCGTNYRGSGVGSSDGAHWAGTAAGGTTIGVDSRGTACFAVRIS